MLLHLFRTPALGIKMPSELAGSVVGTEWHYYIETDRVLSSHAEARLRWLLGETFESHQLGEQSFLQCPAVLEVGPRLNLTTAWSTTAVDICRRCGVASITRLERFRRIGFATKPSDQEVARLHDRMTEMVYEESLQSFALTTSPVAVAMMPVLKEGRQALRRFSKRNDLGLDDQDIEMYYELFARTLRRDPTDVELTQLAQANSEHCRHHRFRGQLVIDGWTAPETLMDVVQTPWRRNPGNSVIAFHDNASALRGFQIVTLAPSRAGQPSPLVLVPVTRHPTLTAETHNHPCGVEPYEGAATGGGGRIRDGLGVGRGGLVVAGGVGYCTANLLIPGYDLPWEKDSWPHSPRMASPLDILIRASDGCYDYGNCFGEPVICGFARTCGLNVGGKPRAWYKPILYSVGTGCVDDHHVSKAEPKKGMQVVLLGGPAYRIGVGGGSASSMITGAIEAELDFQSVQRGAPEMEQRVWRVIRACVEMGDQNPIVSIHDLGAGGTCNALPEIVNPAGAVIELSAIPSGDPTLSALELWVDEAQERMVMLVWKDQLLTLQTLAEREGVQCVAVGTVTGDGKFVLRDQDGRSLVDLPLVDTLGELPQKHFTWNRVASDLNPLQLPNGLTVREALDRVLRLLSVGSKRFLTTKVDRSVTGLIVQQQCVGSHHIPLCDFAAVANSHFDISGVALSLGEQPLKGLINPAAMARMAVAEMLLNLAGAGITAIPDIKCSANWMLAANEPGEGARLWNAACTLRDICLELGMAIDGGKDSMSMAAKLKSPESDELVTVRAPLQLVVASYVPMADVTRKVTPDFKAAGNYIVLVDLSGGMRRLGGSALAQVYGQVGDDCPDLSDTQLLRSAVVAVQGLVIGNHVRAVHDCSDGGLIVALLEMAFAGSFSFSVKLKDVADSISRLFSEELGLVLEVEPDQVGKVLRRMRLAGIPAQCIGPVTDESKPVIVEYNNQVVLHEPMRDLRETWEATSTALDGLQTNQVCVDQETETRRATCGRPQYCLSFQPTVTPPVRLHASNKPAVAILRERGSNGDREMAAAFYAAGFAPWDVTMTDLLNERVSLEQFRGAAFVGGFSFGDVLDSAKGWAGIIRFNERLREQFNSFYRRTDTFSLGICNGCQLMALLGWVPGLAVSDEEQPRFIRNHSGRFESRFPMVRIEPSPAIMLRGMEGSMLGIWVAHGEGRLHVPQAALLHRIERGNLAPIRYVDWTGSPTEQYPLNPNGSPHGIAALCSPDGRHLAMMPHPERLFQLRQWPWLPDEWRSLPASPWLRMFQNAFDWV